MQYHIAKDGVKSGPFEKEVIYQRLGSGELKGSDLGWCEGMGEWEPLSKLLPPPSSGAAQVFAPPVPGSPITHSQPSSTCGLSIASLVCGLLGFVSFGLTSIGAIITGHISLSRIKKSAGALSGRGMAIAGLIIGYLVFALTLLAVVASLMLPVFMKTSQAGNQIKAVSNAKQIIIGMKMYAADHDGNYPPTLDALVEEGILPDQRIFEFPPAMNVPGQGWEYLGAGHGDSSPGNLIVLRSKKADSSKKFIIARSDGSVEAVRESRLQDAAPE